MLSDAELFQRVHFDRTPQEVQEAGKKTIEMMRASPYQKTANAGLFLKALASREGALPSTGLGLGAAWRDEMDRIQPSPRPRIPGITHLARSHIAHTLTSTLRWNHSRGVSANITSGRPSSNSRGAAAT